MIKKQFCFTTHSCKIGWEGLDEENSKKLRREKSVSTLRVRVR